MLGGNSKKARFNGAGGLFYKKIGLGFILKKTWFVGAWRAIPKQIVLGGNSKKGKFVGAGIYSKNKSNPRNVTNKR